MSETPINWPRTGDRAFHASPDRGRIEAFIMPSDGIYLVGFQRAGDMLVDAAKADDRNPDDLFFAIAFLYRHHLELMLKGLVRLGLRSGAIESCDDILNGHNIHKLWNRVARLICEAWPDAPDDDFRAAEQLILEFHKLDPDGQSFRYATDKNGLRHLENAPKRVDLENLNTTV